MDRYKEIGTIGAGSFGQVSMCLDDLTGAVVAVKFIRFNSKRSGLPYLVLREIAILKELNHRNVVRLLDVVEQDGGINLVFEYMARNLRSLIISKDPVDLSPHQIKVGTIKNILFQILEGVSYCHSQKVIHRDLKPHNVLLNSQSNIVKVADFGLSRTTNVPMLQYSTNVATIPYRAPELLLATPYSSAADIWSVGCIFAEMVTKKPLFNAVKDTTVMKEIIRLFGLPDESEWPGVELAILKFFGGPKFPTAPTKDLASVVPDLEPEGLDLLSKMLCIYPNHRITAYDALQHPYLRGVNIVGSGTEQIQMPTRRNYCCCCAEIFQYYFGGLFDVPSPA